MTRSQDDWTDDCSPILSKKQRKRKCMQQREWTALFFLLMTLAVTSWNIGIGQIFSPTILPAFSAGMRSVISPNRSSSSHFKILSDDEVNIDNPPTSIREVKIRKDIYTNETVNSGRLELLGG